MSELDPGDRAALTFICIIAATLLLVLGGIATHDIIVKANGWEEQCEVTE